MDAAAGGRRVVEMRGDEGNVPARAPRRWSPARRGAASGALATTLALLCALPAPAQEAPSGATQPGAPQTPRGAASPPPVPPEAGEAVAHALERYQDLLKGELEQRVGPADDWSVAIGPASPADLRAGKLPPVTAQAVN